MKILDFTTEYMHEPLGVEKPPRFCWRIDSAQQSYRLLVTTEGEVVYDSGEVTSGETVGIAYEGETLVSDSRYDVRLGVTGKDGGKDEYASYFETGLLHPSDWKGFWIGLPANFSRQSVLMRRALCDMPHKPIARARCYVAGLGYHELYVNGRKVGDGVLQPAISDPSKRVYYVAYDVTALLGSGNDVVGVMLGNGWNLQRCLLLQLNVTFADGTRYEMSGNQSYWWARGGAVGENSVYGGEVYDARKETAGWADSSVHADWENGWMYTLRVMQPPTGKLVCQTAEPIRVCDRYVPVEERALGDNVTVYDIGRNISGWCRIRVRGDAGAKVTLLHGEGLKANGEVDRTNLRLAANLDVYILRGEGVEEYAPRFTYHGFRYVQMCVEGNVQVLSLTAEHVHTDVRRAGEFHCSDETLNRLHEMSAVTERNNLHGIMTDCPQRDERFMWLNDLSTRIYETVCNYGMERMFSKIVTDISDTQDERGAIADTAPYFTANRPADPVSVCYLLFALRAYEWYGDKRCIEENYDQFDAWTRFLISRSDDWIMTYSYYGDWVAPELYGETTDNLYVSSAYLYWHLVCMRRIAEIAGRQEDVQTYAGFAESAREAFRRKYYHAEKKSCDNGTQAANAIALSLGLVPDADRSAVAQNIWDDVVRKNMHSSCGNQGYRHMFYVLGDYGYNEGLIEVLKNPEYPGWGYMLANGATTVWERWEKEMQCTMHSFDHPMFGAYDGWMYEYLGGIRISSDAFAADRVVIAPNVPRQLTYVHSSIDTLRGKIVSDWKRTATGICYHVEVPQGVTATLRLQGEKERMLPAGKYVFETCLSSKKEKNQNGQENEESNPCGALSRVDGNGRVRQIG